MRGNFDYNMIAEFMINKSENLGYQRRSSLFHQKAYFYLIKLYCVKEEWIVCLKRLFLNHTISELVSIYYATKKVGSYKEKARSYF